MRKRLYWIVKEPSWFNYPSYNEDQSFYKIFTLTTWLIILILNRFEFIHSLSLTAAIILIWLWFITANEILMTNSWHRSFLVFESWLLYRFTYRLLANWWTVTHSFVTFRLQFFGCILVIIWCVHYILGLWTRIISHRRLMIWRNWRLRLTWQNSHHESVLLLHHHFLHRI